MHSNQCQGVTLKGQRCLKKVTDGSWCNYHLSQSDTHSKSASKKNQSKSASPERKPKTSSRSSSPEKRNSQHHRSTPPTPGKYSAQSPGFIYVYTLQSFLDDKSGTIKTRNLIKSDKKKDKWVEMQIKGSKILIIKVGMTTKTPAIRISQWEAKCSHKLSCLYPNSHEFNGSSFIEFFSKLTLKSEPSKSRSFPTFQESNKGFYVPRGVLNCERDIHGLLKSKFGRGDIHCTGCVEKKKADESSRSRLSFLNLLPFKTKEQDYNIHNEWFPVPKSEMHEVYNIIDSVCKKYR